jgi:hypothetical protein
MAASEPIAQEIAYVLLFRCEKCNRPITSWLRTPLIGGYGLEHLKAKAFPLTCVQECGWVEARMGGEAIEIFQAPWTFARVQSSGTK